jgi:hypothetical protein
MKIIPVLGLEQHTYVAPEVEFKKLFRKLMENENCNGMCVK